jgi:DNA-binding LacI/PurR family transcriptional regulator
LKQKVTLRHIAEEAGVTAATVSDILNDRDRCWASAATRTRVREAAARLGYQVNRAARLLRTGNSRLIGIVVSDLRNPFYVSLVRQLESFLQPQGYDVIIEDSRGEPEQEARALQSLQSLSVDGMICATMFCHSQESFFRQFRDSGKALVFVGEPYAGLKVKSVQVDDAEALADLARLLREHGHERIGYVSAQSPTLRYTDRETRFRRALEAQGLSLPPTSVFHCNQQLKDVAGCVQGICQLPAWKRPTALLAINDFAAVAVIRSIMDSGLRIPEDISVVGFDDIDLARWLPVRLTTIGQSYEKLAAGCVSLLTQNGQKPGTELPALTVQAELVVRDSLGPAARYAV